MSQAAFFGDLRFRLATDEDRDDIVEAFFTYMMQGNITVLRTYYCHYSNIMSV
jgi:hypothetical protein